MGDLEIFPLGDSCCSRARRRLTGVVVMTMTAATDLELLRDLNQAYLDSVRTGDVERFRELLADDFLCSTPAGEILDKTQFLARTAGPRTLERLAGEDIRIRILGD